VIWTLCAADARRFAESVRVTFKVSVVPIVGRVELRDGRTYTTRARLRL
jgi:hypothetical protein